MSFILFKIIVITLTNFSYFCFEQDLLIKVFIINPRFLSHIFLFNIVINYFSSNNFVSLSSSQFLTNHIYIFFVSIISFNYLHLILYLVNNNT